MRENKRLCEWCGKEMKRNNMTRHMKNCVWKNQVEMKKADLVEIRRNGKIIDKEEFETKDIAFAELSKYLQDVYNSSIYLYRKIILGKQRSPTERLLEMQVSEITKKYYLREWKHFQKWLKANNKCVSKDTANTYLASLTTVRASTLRTKHSLLENILKFLVDPTITLNKFNKRISFTPKYVMKDEEIEPFLEEQKGIDFEYYLIQKLMITYGLRVNSIASLKVKHLEFLTGENEIHFPDSKVQRERTEPIEAELIEDLEEHLPEDPDEEEYVFYLAGRHLFARQRAHDIGVKVNKAIRSSKVIRKSGNYKYSSHMFRKTRVYTDYQEGVERLKESMRKRIGQSQGSTAINSYINVNI